jgi:hypothetical protein
VKPWHVGVACVALHALLLALVFAAAGCGHFRRFTTTTTATQESAASTASSAAVTAQSSAVEKKQHVRRTARRTTTRPDGWTVKEEVIDDLVSVASASAARSDHASASRTAVEAKAATATKQEAVKRWTRPWWHWAVSLAVGLVLVALAWRQYRRAIRD